jgi:hypothetical protein
MDPNNINDIRNDFKNITFSKYQKSKAKNELINSIYSKKIENACYWCAEFICSGHFLYLWEIIIFYYCKYIHIGNPKIAIYLKMRYNNFIEILNSGYTSNILQLRNNNKIRIIFSEIICILSLSQKKLNFENIKINKTNEFDLINMSDKLKAPNSDYIKDIFDKNDPQEIFIPLNELMFNLKNKNIADTCYWLEWILEYDSLCKNKKHKLACESRSYAPVEFRNDIIWIIWDIIYHCNNNNDFNDFNVDKKKIINNILEALFSLFTIKYKSSIKKKRKFILYICFSILIENINFDTNISKNLNEIKNITDNIDSIYKQIKKNEVSPKTDYLFNGLNKSNIEKTFEKMEIMNNL